MSERVEMTVNGEPVQIDAALTETLVFTLRERLDLKSVKTGCDDGSCGSCTVLLDGAPVNACLVLSHAAAEHDVKTVEGLSSQNELSALQRAFVELGAAQCGFCIPGMLLSAQALLDSHADIDRETIRRALAGNICRCTGYEKQIDAVLAATQGSR